MTTVAALLDAEDVGAFVSSLRDWPNSEVVYDNCALAVSPFTTFYFLCDPSRHVETALSMLDVHERFEALIGKPYRLATHPTTERPHPYGSKRLPDLRAIAQSTPLKKHFVFNFTDETNSLSSPANAAYCWRSSMLSESDHFFYSHVQLYFRWQWWLDNQSEWRKFVSAAAEILNADQAYSGFAMANPLDLGARAEVAVWERALAPHFYGLDIDYPFGMARALREGIRPPTWAFLLSDSWREKLGLTREQIRTRLDDPQILITDMKCGQWIELGKQPALCSVGDGLPMLQMKLNKLLRPIRASDLSLVGLGQWDGDPNVRFDRSDTQRWLARFDEDGDWPSAASRLSPGGAPPALAQRPSPTHAGQPCPREGFWSTPAKSDSRHRFRQGELMPTVGSDYGAVIWHWDKDQT